MKNQPDIILKAVIELTERMRAEGKTAGVPVTLNVRGTLVSGTICDKEEFLNSNPISEHINSIFKEVEAEERAKEEADAKAAGKPLPENVAPKRCYIHLSNARFFGPADKPIPTKGPGVFWRGKLTAVDGFTFGELTVS